MARRSMTTIQNILRWIVIFGVTFSALPLLASTDKVPHEIAGIGLGTNIDDYPEIVGTNFLKEVVVTDWHGFRKGVISYGTCMHVDQVLKIDMKYKDKSEAFFKKLLKRYRKDFGKPDRWTGDSFGVMRVWKWQFIDEEQNRISLALQYNGKNSDETLGNMVKLSYPDKIEAERLCFIDVCAHSKEKIDPKRREELNKFDWSHLVPR